MMDEMMDEMMAAHLPESVKFALTVAFGSVYILEHILAYVKRISPRSPVLDNAVADLVVALPVIYIMAVVVMYMYYIMAVVVMYMYMYLREARPPAAARQLALRWSAGLACALAILLLMLVIALVAFLFLCLAVLLSPDSSGLTPT